MVFGFIMKIVKLVFLLFFIASCTTDPILVNPDLSGDYFVRCKIWPGIEKVGAVVGKTRPQDISVDISGAVVAITHNNQSTILSEYQAGFYIDQVKEIKVVSGEKYSILVNLPDGHVLSGDTFVPGDFSIHSTSDTLLYVIQQFNNQIYESHPEPLFWNISQNAFCYGVAFFDPSSLFGSYVPTFKTTGYLPDQDDVFSDLTETILIEERIIAVTAYDSTFLPGYRWRLPESELETVENYKKTLNLIEGQNDNINGGIGYFCSHTTILDTILIRFEKRGL